MSLAKIIEEIREKRDETGILTIHLNTDSSAGNGNNGEWKIHLKNGFKTLKEEVKDRNADDELKALKKLQEKVEKEVTMHQREMRKGFILVASSDGELYRARVLQVPVTTSFHWGKTAETQQIEELEQRFPETAIVSVQQADVTFIETSLGIIRDTKKFSWDVESESWLDYDEVVHQQTRGGGRDEFQRRFEENQHRWYKSLAAEIDRDVKKRKLEGVYLVGSQESVQEVETHLNGTKVLGVITKNLGSKQDHEIVAEVFDTLV
ncbi:VLRF1 family aeRF1-type release factor [Jeotgalicoccus marinus]|uniref:VLRF1 family aeRF1-type release factor n=1 Tax=Jeotgalicoccus marinus TaxID=516700 RepID=UPI0004218B74|nr:VLRF1 family aeRF1-type release factor [Jeotgalicoccus marinus]